MLDWFRQRLNGRQITALSLLAVVVAFGTIGRLNIEKLAEAKGWDQILVRVEGPVTDVIGLVSRVLGSDLAIGIALGGVIFAFWGWIGSTLAAVKARMLGRQVKPVTPQAADLADNKGAQIEKNRLHDRIRILDRALHKLMNLEIDRLERVVMTQLLAESPAFADDEDISDNTELMQERTARLQRYTFLVVQEVKPMRGGADIPRAVLQAEADEAERLKKTPNVPPGVNAYVYRDYAIAIAKRKVANAYMKKAISESERSDMRYLGDMIEREKDLEPKIFDSGF